MFAVKVHAIGQGEIEWTETFVSETSLRGAKSAATRWIKRTLCTSDYSTIEKEQVSAHSRRATWWIR